MPLIVPCPSETVREGEIYGFNEQIDGIITVETDMNETYAEQNRIKQLRQLRSIQESLPEFTEDFFRGIADITQVRTRIAYAYDLKIFFYFLKTSLKKFSDRKDVTDFYIDDLDRLKATDLDRYSEFLNMYTMPVEGCEGKVRTYTNNEKGKQRKLSSLRSFYAFYYKKEMISTNPSLLINMPKIHEKPIIRLDVNEVAELLDTVESGEDLSPRQAAFHKRTGLRDLAIITLFLGTGIRISELVGLNISDFSFKDNSFIATRKGGNRMILYFSDEVKKALLDYYDNDRKDVEPADPSDEQAFFLSLQKKRISARAVEKLLDKYIKVAVPLKKISPHKLRSTFGTNLYNETNDIYLVADVLGHKDVNTTRRHYAAMEEDRRRIAAKVTKLREE